jgi:hypothetical protein
MLEVPTMFLRDPGVMLKIMRTWAKPKSAKAGLYPPTLGPNRTQMLTLLGLPVTQSATPA